MIDILITNEEKVHIALTPATAGGNPAEVEAGSGVFTVTSGDGTVEADSDTFGAFLVSGSAVGDTVYHVEADADLGSGVKTISEDITLHVVQASASSLGIAQDVPVLK